MDTKKELRKWKEEHAKATTTEAKAAHQKRFKEYLQSLSSADRKAFVAEFRKEAKESVEEARKLTEIVERKQKLEKVLDFTSMSYIARQYFGKSRQWMYQRVNGNVINGKPADFTSDELRVLSTALSELGDMLKQTSVAIV